MTARVDLDDVAATTTEKFLAVVLAAFLLIGSIWFYVKVDDWVGGRTQEFSASEQQVLDARDRAYAAEEKATTALERERSEVELAKNAVEIAEAQGESVDAAATKYQEELREFQAAQSRADDDRAQTRRAEKAAGKIEKAHWDRPRGAEALAVAGIRLGFIVVCFAGALRLVSSLRKRQSRFVPLGFAAVATGVVTALVFATDYITDYIDPLDLGPIVLSAAGAIATIASFVGLQRWLARRLPGRRVRNGECPFCGHPVRADGPHCEGCGREVVTSCTSCGAPRRVGSPHCASCGAA
jgi:hypothetical protein